MSQFADRIEPRDFGKMPKEYQDLLTRLLAIQADCEIGGPHIVARQEQGVAFMADAYERLSTENSPASAPMTGTSATSGVLASKPSGASTSPRLLRPRQST